MPRAYQLKARALGQAETRTRIVAAAVELHRKLGPANTTFSAVAELAGVQRHTLYRHFPDQAALLRGCREHFLGTNPPPVVTRWSEVASLDDRFRRGLSELYRYYGAHEELIWRSLRDADRVPSGEGFRRLHRAAAVALAGGQASPGRPVEAAALLATDFIVWRELTSEGNLRDDEIVELMSALAATALGRCETS